MLVKRIFFIGILMSVFDVMNAQRDSSEFNIYKYKPTPKDRLVLEVNHTGWLGVPNNLREKIFSGGVNFMLFFDHPMGTSHFSFAWGGSISSYNIHGPIDIVYTTDSASRTVQYSALTYRNASYDINRIGLKIIEAPVEFRFRTWTDYQFKLSLGFKIGYVVQSFRKIYDSNGKVKIYDIAGINPWRYGITLRMGWEQLHLTAFYSLSEFFASGKGTPGVIPFSVGFAYTPRISLGGR
jgi:hypothetical protein